MSLLHFAQTVQQRRKHVETGCADTAGTALAAAALSATPSESRRALTAAVERGDAPAGWRLKLADMLMWGLKGERRDWRRKACDLYQDAAEFEEDPEAMIMSAGASVKTHTFLCDRCPALLRRAGCKVVVRCKVVCACWCGSLMLLMTLCRHLRAEAACHVPACPARRRGAD